jgi:Acyclic terpene utilisation family protein AtuA
VTKGALRVANCSGFFGDRLDAAREMVEGGPVDVLTGDWLAELTLLILARQRLRDPRLGYARTFITQMTGVLGQCVDRGIKIVTNAGGLNPAGCADALTQLADTASIPVRVATVEGDDLLARLDALRLDGEAFVNTDTGEPYAAMSGRTVAANAYLGHWGIAEALRRGADVVICGRVTDAALVAGPAAWHFGWGADDLDAIAGAVVAGHVLECGCQATGGNFSFFTEIPGMARLGFPLAEIHENGSAVITKHPGTGGAVTVETVTAQLLYEVASPSYLGPDCVAHFDTASVSQVGPDRVLVSGTRGSPPPGTLRVAVNYLSGYRNTVSFVFSGLDVPAKMAVAESALWELVPGGRAAFDEIATDVVGSIDADGSADGLVELRVSVIGTDEEATGRGFSGVAVQTALASYPGCHLAAPPGAASEVGVLWPTTVARERVHQAVVLGGERIEIPDRWVQHGPDPAGPGHADERVDEHPLAGSGRGARGTGVGRPEGGPTVHLPIGRVVGARSGDKGGHANLGVWARSDAGFEWLRHFLSVDELTRLLPDVAGFDVDRYEFANLRACNFVVRGYLGRGVAASLGPDPQAKNLGERLRARQVDLPLRLLESGPG